MAKEKKGGKRLNKKQLAEVLIDYFQSRPGETMSMKQVFKNLRLTTHPMKMLALDIMEDMAWNDFLAKDGEYAYRLNTKGQVQEGTFQRKANGKNTFLPDDGGTPIFVSERNSMSALTGDRVRVQFLARRRNHIKEAMVTEILHRKKDTFTGKLRVDRDIAFLVTQEALFVHDILVPKKRLKGGKTGDRAVVRAIHFYNDSRRAGEIYEAIKADDFDRFLQLIIEGGHSSFEFNQNAYSIKNPQEQGVPLALALSQKVLNGRGAWRLQGGGFAGTIQAFVPLALLETYKNAIDAVFGAGSCHVLSVRNYGAVMVTPDM